MMKEIHDIEYGVVLNEENDKYDIMSVGFENKNGKFVEYPTNVENLVQCLYYSMMHNLMKLKKTK